MAAMGQKIDRFFHFLAVCWLKILRIKVISQRLLKFPTMPTLTKRDLVIKISDHTGLTQGEVFNVIQMTLDSITEALAQGHNVELRKFGVFEVRLTKPRVGRNPNEPEVNVPIPARATVKFKAGKTMRQSVLLRTETLQSDPPPKRTRRRKTPATE